MALKWFQSVSKYQHVHCSKTRVVFSFNQVSFTYLCPKTIHWCPVGLGSLFFIVQGERTGVKLTRHNTGRPAKIFKIKPLTTKTVQHF